MRAHLRRAVPWIAAALATLVPASRIVAGEPLEARLVFPPGWSAPVRVVTSGTGSFKVAPTEVGDRYAGGWSLRVSKPVTPVVFCSNTGETHIRVEPPAAPVFAGVRFSTGGGRAAAPVRTVPAIPSR
jgi:hypothetical protein